MGKQEINKKINKAKESKNEGFPAMNLICDKWVTKKPNSTKYANAKIENIFKFLGG